MFDKQGGGRGSHKWQQYNISLCSKPVNRGGGVINSQNPVNVFYECLLSLNYSKNTFFYKTNFCNDVTGSKVALCHLRCGGIFQANIFGSSVDRLFDVKISTSSSNAILLF